MQIENPDHCFAYTSNRNGGEIESKVVFSATRFAKMMHRSIKTDPMDWAEFVREMNADDLVKYLDYLYGSRFHEYVIHGVPFVDAYGIGLSHEAVVDFIVQGARRRSSECGKRTYLSAVFNHEYEVTKFQKQMTFYELLYFSPKEFERFTVLNGRRNVSLALVRSEFERTNNENRVFTYIATPEEEENK